jgi:hypothetical protein
MDNNGSTGSGIHSSRQGFLNTIVCKFLSVIKELVAAYNYRSPQGFLNTNFSRFLSVKELAAAYTFPTGFPGHNF